MRLRKDPGPFIPYDQVKSKLNGDAFGVNDLVDMGLFYSDFQVRKAMQAGRLKSQKVNHRSVVFCRDHILDYWKQYRSIPTEPTNCLLSLRLSQSEADYLKTLVNSGRMRSGPDFSVNDIFRNIIRNMKQAPDLSLSDPLFIKNY